MNAVKRSNEFSNYVKIILIQKICKFEFKEKFCISLNCTEYQNLNSLLEDDKELLFSIKNLLTMQLYVEDICTKIQDFRCMIFSLEYNSIIEILLIFTH